MGSEMTIIRVLGTPGLALCSLWLLFGCGGDDGEQTPDSGPPSALAETLCRETMACSGADAAAAELELCHMLIGAAFQLTPDPDFTAACLEALSCAELEDEASVQACLDLDHETVSCEGTTLHGCTHYGRCSEVACSTACGWLGA